MTSTESSLRGKQLTRRYSIAVGVELLAIPVAALSPRAGVALSLGVVAFCLIPPPKPRDRDGQPPAESDVAGVRSEQRLEPDG